MLGFLNAIGRTSNATLPWYLSSPFQLNDNAAALSVDFRSNRYAVDQQSQSFQETFTYSRTTIATYVDGNGILQHAAIDEPRFSRNPINGVVSYYHEGEATNLIRSSEDFAVNWSALNCDDSVEGTAPDGVSQSTRLESNSASDNAARCVQGNIAGDAGEYTFSTFAKKGNSHVGIGTDNELKWVRFDLDNGTVRDTQNATGTIEPLADGWYRVSATFTTDANHTDIRPALYIDNGQSIIFSRPRSIDGDYVYVWGADFEVGHRATSYIFTNASSTQTRSADNLSIAGTDFNAFFNATEGTTFIRYTRLKPDASEELVLCFDDGTISNRMEIGLIGGEGFRGRWRCVLAGADQANIGLADSAPFPINTVTKYAQNDFAATNDDKAFNTDTSGNVTTVDRMIIGGRSSINQPFFGWIESIAYFGSALSQADMQTLSMPDYAYLVDGDSYSAGAGGVGLSDTLNDRNLKNQSNGVGGSTLEQAVQRIESNPLSGNKPFIFVDGSVNGNSGVVTTEIAKYQRIIDATNGNCVIVSPVLYTGLSGVDRQFTLDLTAALLAQSWGSQVIDTTAIARTLSGASFTDATDASDAGYANAAYDALFQVDNIHPEQDFMDSIVEAALAAV